MLSDSISLLDLPNELLYKIIDLLEPLDVQTLSLAMLNDSIRFICNENQVVPTKSQLQYARSLFITTDQPYYPDKKLGPTKQWKDRINLPALFGRKAKKAQKPLSDLRDVILSLDKVNSVRWTLPYVRPALGDSFPNGTGLNFDSILKLLAGLPSLDNFTFNAYYLHSIYLSKNTRFGLENLRGLKSLSFTGLGTEEFWSAIMDPLIVVVRNSPELEELSLPLLNGGDGKLSLGYFLLLSYRITAQPLRKLSLRADAQNLPIDRASGIHLENLKNLDVVSPSGHRAHWPATPTINDGLWAFLGHYRVKLKHIYAPMTVDLIDYLQTYSGVENLGLYGTVDAGPITSWYFALACNFTKGAEHLSCTGDRS